MFSVACKGTHEKKSHKHNMTYVMSTTRILWFVLLASFDLQTAYALIHLERYFIAHLIS